jgi:hypothetical protein
MFLFELIAMFGLGWVTLNPKVRVENSPAIWFGVALVVAAALHFTIVRLVEATRIRNRSIRADVNRAWTILSGVQGSLSLVKSGFLAALALIAIVWLGGHARREWNGGELAISIATYAYAGGHLAYWSLAALVYYLFRGRVAIGAGFLCTLVGDRLVFALGKNSFEVGIDELSELRVLANYGEGAAFFQRYVSLNIPVIVQNPVETTRWLAGKVNRPRIFIQPPSTGLPSVFLRAPDVFVFAPLLARSAKVLQPFERPSLEAITSS